MDCKICKGESKYKCLFCGHKKKAEPKPKKKRKKDYDLADHQAEYLLETWQKLKKYNSGTTGIPELDDACRNMFGPWN